MSDVLQMDPVLAMLAQTSLKNTLFTATSRYYGIGVETIAGPQGTTLAYVQRRFLPAIDQMQVIQLYTVVQGDRLDTIAAQYLGDPRLFWRLCDANNAMRPAALTHTPGTKLNITMPPGVTGTLT
ncbi:LysM peptidoglycan-binding domain-containing protein [Paraburkholderia guartelaensis]|uniref:LysM peptidoglycan-binding domain-containing protein n=1 Tax=Paraburkholderia guartelaensis TaxID=2546446 RepID=UPI002AB72CF5|nr:LysM domain-containing protein [Paraburkholderia guartelaensis]